MQQISGDVNKELFEQHLYWLLLVTCYIKCSHWQAVISTPVLFCYSSWETNSPHFPKKIIVASSRKNAVRRWMELEGSRSVISWLWNPEGSYLRDRSCPSYFSPSHSKQCLTNKAVFSQNFAPVTEWKGRAGKTCYNSHNTSFCRSPQVIPSNDHS